MGLMLFDNNSSFYTFYLRCLEVQRLKCLPTLLPKFFFCRIVFISYFFPMFGYVNVTSCKNFSNLRFASAVVN